MPRGRSARDLDAEIEYRAPAPAGEAKVLADGDLIWATSPADEIYASAQIATGA